MECRPGRDIHNGSAFAGHAHMGSCRLRQLEWRDEVDADDPREVLRRLLERCGYVRDPRVGDDHVDALMALESGGHQRGRGTGLAYVARDGVAALEGLGQLLDAVFTPCG